MKAADLKRSLELVRPGLARKELLEQSMSIIFRENHIFTFNDEVAVVAPLETGITGAVPSDPLYAFLGKLGEGAEIKVEAQENEFRFSSGRNRAGIRRDEDIKLPLDEEIPEPEEWTALPDKFLEALRRILFSCAGGGHRPILTCVHITEAWMESCDGYRMTRAQSQWNSDDNTSICIVGKNLGKLPQYSPTHFGSSSNWIQFKNKDGVRYAVRIVEGEYPDLNKFTEVEGEEIEFPTEMENALDWASIIVDSSVKSTQKIDVSIGKGQCTVKGEGPEGWAEQSVRMKYSGKPIIFQAHPQMLKEMVKLARKITIGDKSVKIEAEDFVHIVSLE